ncbi:sugar phosphate isomerase/epimerase family protein [Clostridium sp. DL1XJH146]
MKIGMSSACFYPDMDVEDSVEKMKNLGFDCGELFINSPSEFNDKFANILLEKINEHNFKVVSIHGFSSFFEPFMFSKYKRRRDDMMKYFSDLCKLGKKIGADSYTFHGMRLVDRNVLSLPEIIDRYNEISYIAAENGIKFSQENVSWCISSDLNFIGELKEKIENPLYFTLDLKQANKARKNPIDYIKVMGDKLVNFHINDYDDENVCLLPGNGAVNYNEIFSELKKVNYNGEAIIEVYRNNYENYVELSKCKDYLEKIHHSL